MHVSAQNRVFIWLLRDRFNTGAVFVHSPFNLTSIKLQHEIYI
ncbi:hypothetical protein TRICHSKD4_0904 [Roseibium sp. TrichSKD4]|nr:hypothetical protein TRICHSKD4_0904 [Roseibium sp. TrichSKD4]